MILIDIKGKAELIDEVKQCLTVILNTRKGTLAMDRDFGIDYDFLDLNTMQAQAKVRHSVLEAVKKYEPRATINNISFKSDTNGKLIPTLEVYVHE